METIELFDKYIDNQLSQAEVQLLEVQLGEDAEMQNLLDSMLISRKAIQFRAVTMKVKGLHEQYIKEVRSKKEDNIRVLPITRVYSWAMRIAATIFIGLVGYQYIALNSSRVYNEKFISYQLPTIRGKAEQKSELNALYSSGNYTAVVEEFNTRLMRTPSDYFLTGVAQLQRKDYKSAIAIFNALRQYNRQHTEAYFDQESDYYLALAYLGADRVDEAYSLFKHIHDTPHHLFSQSITEIDLLKLSLLRLKI
jgi:tetratricopeptide (TPR) repeat protein